MCCLVPSSCEAEDAVCIVWLPCFVMLKMLRVLSGSHVCDTEDAVCIVWLPVLVMLKKGV